MLHAYLDESGIHDQAKVCIIAGYWANPNRWRTFESDWKRLLSEFRVPMEELHATQLLRRQGFFKDWGGHKYSAFLERVALTIASHKRIRPISAGVVVDDFNQFDPDFRAYLTGAGIRDGKLLSPGTPNTPYFMIFQQCIARIAGYANEGEVVHFSFGLDTSFGRRAYDLIKEIKESPNRFPWKDRLGEPFFPEAKKTPELQAADLLAYLTYRHMTDGSEPLGTKKPSRLLQLCIANKRNNADFFFTTADNIVQNAKINAALTNPPDFPDL
jgi:hypothetical protein